MNELMKKTSDIELLAMLEKAQAVQKRWLALYKNIKLCVNVVLSKDGTFAVQVDSTILDFEKTADEGGYVVKNLLLMPCTSSNENIASLNALIVDTESKGIARV